MKFVEDIGAQGHGAAIRARILSEGTMEHVQGTNPKVIEVLPWALEHDPR